MLTDQQRKDFEALGEDAVRHGVTRNFYWQPGAMASVQEWLQEREDARNERSQAPSLRIAKSAKTAAWIAAIAAVIAIPIAIAAIVISYVAWASPHH